MRSILGKKLVIVVCLGAHVLSVLGIPAGIMWCVGPDGHQGIELAHADTRCSDAASGDKTYWTAFVARQAVASDASQRCIDTPLPTWQMRRVFAPPRLKLCPIDLLPMAWSLVVPPADNAPAVRLAKVVESASSHLMADARHSVNLLL